MLNRAFATVRRSLVPQVPAFQIALVGFRVGRRRGDGGAPGREAGQQLPGDAILQIEDPVRCSIELTRPQDLARAHGDQLERDAQPTALGLHSAVQDRVNTELAAGGPRVNVLSGKDQNQIRRAHGNATHAAEGRDQPVGDAQAQIGVVDALAEGPQRQHRHGTRPNRRHLRVARRSGHPYAGTADRDEGDRRCRYPRSAGGTPGVAVWLGRRVSWNGRPVDRSCGFFADLSDVGKESIAAAGHGGDILGRAMDLAEGLA